MPMIRYDTRKALLFGIFVTHGTRAAMERANERLAQPVKLGTLRAWFNRWRRLPLPNILARFGKF